MKMELFQERITSEMARKNVNKTDLGVVLGVSDVTVGYWCHGKRTPSLQQLAALAGYFGTTVDYLIGVSDNPGRVPSLADDLGLSDLAISNLRSITSAPDRREALSRMLEFAGLSSALANIALANKLRSETSGNIQTVDLPDELISEVSKHGYVILSNRQSADYLEDQAMDQMRRAFNRRG